MQDLQKENRYGEPLLLLPETENLLTRFNRKMIKDTPPLTGGEEKVALPFVGRLHSIIICLTE
jgi:hypothetical protein